MTAPSPDYSGSCMLALYPSPDVAGSLALPDGLDPADIHLTLAYCGGAAYRGRQAAWNAMAGAR